MKGTKAGSRKKVECQNIKTTLFGAMFEFLDWGKLQGGPGSVRFGYSLGVEQFELFWFSVPAVLCFSTV